MVLIFGGFDKLFNVERFSVFHKALLKMLFHCGMSVILLIVKDALNNLSFRTKRRLQGWISLSCNICFAVSVWRDNAGELPRHLICTNMMLSMFRNIPLTIGVIKTNYSAPSHNEFGSWGVGSGCHEISRQVLWQYSSTPKLLLNSASGY